MFNLNQCQKDRKKYPMTTLVLTLEAFLASKGLTFADELYFEADASFYVDPSAASDPVVELAEFLDFISNVSTTLYASATDADGDDHLVDVTSTDCYYDPSWLTFTNADAYNAQDYNAQTFATDLVDRAGGLDALPQDLAERYVAFQA
jgi:hypothetical protein